jgi:hypothetical protein
MKVVRLRFVNFEHGALATIGDEVMWPVLEPAVQHRLVTRLVVTHANDKVLLYPDQEVLERKAGSIKGCDEVGSVGMLVEKAKGVIISSELSQRLALAGRRVKEDDANGKG